MSDQAKVSILLEAKDQLSGVLRQAEQETKQLGQGIAELKAAALEQIEQQTGVLAAAFKGLVAQQNAVATSLEHIATAGIRTQETEKGLLAQYSQGTAALERLAASADRVEAAQKKLAQTPPPLPIEDIGKKAKQSHDEAGGLIEQIAQGFGFAAANQIFDRGIGLIRSIAHGIQDAAINGLQFNATLETSTTAVAALVRQFEPGRVRDFSQAMGIASGVVEQIRVQAADSPATFEQLLSGFRSISGLAYAANIPLSKQVDLVLLLSQAVSGLGLPAEQLAQESRALLTGDIGPDATLARALQISPEQISRARAGGQLFEFLEQRLGSFREAADVARGSLTVNLSNLGDNLQNLKGIATQDIFRQFREGLIALNKYLSSDEAKSGAIALKNLLGDAVGGAKDTVGLLAKLTGGKGDSGLASILSPAAGVASGIFGNYKADADAEVKLDAYAAKVKKVRDDLLASQTPEQYDAARTKVFTEAEKFDGSEAGQTALRNLQRLIELYPSLAAVQERTRRGAAEETAERQKQLAAAVELTANGKTEQERAKGRTELTRLQTAEIQRGYQVNNENLGVIASTLRQSEAQRGAAAGVTSGLRDSQGVLTLMKGDTKAIADNFDLIGKSIFSATQQLREMREGFRAAQIGPDQAGQLGELERRISVRIGELNQILRDTTKGRIQLGGGGFETKASQFGDYRRPNGSIGQDNSDVGKVATPRTTASGIDFSRLPDIPGIAIPEDKMRELGVKLGDTLLVSLNGGVERALKLIEVGPGSSRVAKGIGADLTQPAILALGGNPAAAAAGAFSGSISYRPLGAGGGAGDQGSVTVQKLIELLEQNRGKDRRDAGLFDVFKDVDESGIQRILGAAKELNGLQTQRIGQSRTARDQASSQRQDALDQAGVSAKLRDDNEAILRQENEKYRISREQFYLSNGASEAAAKEKAEGEAALKLAADRAEFERQNRIERLQSALDENRAQQQKAAVSGLPYGQQQAQTVQLQRQELQITQALISARLEYIRLKEQSTAPADIRGVQQARVALSQDQTAAAGLRSSIGGATSLTKALDSELSSLQSRWGNASKAIASGITGSIGTALDGVSTGITGLIFHTGNWQQTVVSAAQSIVGSLISITLQQTVGMALVSGVRKALGLTDQASAAAQAATAGAAWAGPAFLASTATFGAAAGTGAAALAAGYASSLGLAAAGSVAGGFRRGGYTGDGPEDEVAGEVHRQEVVVSAPNVRRHGLANILAATAADAVPLSRRIASSAAPAAGGASSAGGGSASSSRSRREGPAQIHLALFSDESRMRQYQQSARGERHTLSLVDRKLRAAGLTV